MKENAINLLRTILGVDNMFLIPKEHVLSTFEETKLKNFLVWSKINYEKERVVKEGKS